MATRQTNEQILSSNSNGGSLSDLLVALKPGPNEKDKVAVRLRMIGEPIVYWEYNARIRDYDTVDDKGRPTQKDVPFPDATKRKSLTRIGHDDPEKCEWKKMGYIGSKKYAQNCIMRHEDGTWSIKILNKGATVFKPMAEWENGRVTEKFEDGIENLTTFLGGLTAPEVRVIAHRDSKAPGRVRYEVNILTRETTLTEEEIKALGEIYSPNAEEMAKCRKAYEERKASDRRLPDFEEFFEQGHNLQNIFKYTPPILDDEPAQAQTTSTATVHVPDETESQEEAAESTDASSTQAMASVFSNLGEEEPDDWEL